VSLLRRKGRLVKELFPQPRDKGPAEGGETDDIEEQLVAKANARLFRWTDQFERHQVHVTGFIC